MWSGGRVGVWLNGSLHFKIIMHAVLALGLRSVLSCCTVLCPVTRAGASPRAPCCTKWELAMPSPYIRTH